jgi:hypothetical protein
MNIQKAKAIPIAEILEKIGAKPIKKTKNEYWYHSPLREENTASFHVNIKSNIWYDFGIGKGGDNIDLVCQHLEASKVGCSVSDALRWFDNMFGQAITITPIRTSEPRKSESKLKLLEVRDLSFRGLLNYLENRGIPLSIGKIALKELRVQNLESGKSFLAVGLINEDDGYEIRNPKVKSSVKAKNISFIRGTNPNKKGIHIFEGFMDYLSAIAENNNVLFEEDTIVLNSLSLLPKATPYIKDYGYRIAYTWLDNDDAGQKATKALHEFFSTQEGLDHVSMNEKYLPHKDVNEWRMNKLGLKMEG